VVEMQDQVAPDMVLIGAGMRYHMLLRLEQSAARILTSTQVVGVADGAVSVRGTSGEVTSLPADSIVWAAGVTPKPIDTSQLDPGLEVFLIGDCVKPRNMLDAVWEGSRIARAL
jgi:NADH dehydrogenase FAD-containing subunit